MKYINILALRQIVAQGPKRATVYATFPFEEMKYLIL